MSFFWVQQWVALPVIYEPPMGELPPSSRPQALDHATAGLMRDGVTPISSTPYKVSDSNAPFYSQLSTVHQTQLRPEPRAPAQPNTHYHHQEHTATALNMGAMAAALPGHASTVDLSPNQTLQTLPHAHLGAPTSPAVYQHGANLTMTGHAPSISPSHPSYGSGFPPNPYQQTFAPPLGSQHNNYPSFGTNTSRPAGPTPIHNPYQAYTHASQYMYFPPSYASQGQLIAGYAAQGAQAQGLLGGRASLTTTSLSGQGPMMDYSSNERSFAGVRVGPDNHQIEPNMMGTIYGGAPLVQGPGMD